MTDLRRKFSTILRKYGHDIYLQRRTNAYTSETASFRDDLEKHTVRHMYSANIGAPGVANEDIVGISHDSEMIYYFQYNSNPREGDRLYENLEEYPNELVTWIVDFAIPMRMQRGRIEYWVVGVSREEVPIG
jgi:hypothetical protein